MFFAKTCRHFDGLLGKKYTYSGFYLESEKKGCLCQNLKMYKSYNGEALWEGEGHGKEEDMESAYMTISNIISRKY